MSLRQHVLPRSLGRISLDGVLVWFQVSMFCHGARVGFYQGDISLLMDDIKTLKPTFFPVVPRLLNRIYDKVRSFRCRPCKIEASLPWCLWCLQIQASVTSVLKRAVLNYAVRRKQAELSSGVVRNNSVWDRLIFNKIQVPLWLLCFILISHWV